METTPFFALLFVHLGALVLAFGSVLVTDLHGLWWLRDRVRFPHVVRTSGVNEKFIWAGWGLMVATGVPLVVLKGEVDNLMLLKLFFVALIGINGVALGLLQKRIDGHKEGDDVPAPVLFRLALSLGVSQLAWWGAFLIGFLHRQVRPAFAWPQAPWLWIVAFVAGVLLLWGGGEWWIARHRLKAETVKEKITP